jgi:hypothetical protein
LKPGQVHVFSERLCFSFSLVVLIPAIQRGTGRKRLRRLAEDTMDKLILTLLALFGYAPSMEWFGLPHHLRIHGLS